MGNPIHKPIYVLRQFLIIILVVELRLCIFTPANFVFGDSLVDSGNNNYIVSLSKADFSPNGIDFGKPTGRYTNGRTIVDIVGKFSSFPFINPNQFHYNQSLMCFCMNRA